MPKLLTLFVLFSVFDSPRSLLAQYTHTYIEKGLAITTSGAMDVFNETYNTKMLALNELISPAIRDSKLIDTISKYKDNPTKQRAALDILSTLHADVFIEDKVEFQAGIDTMSYALEPDPKTKKYAFDCDTSSYVYMEIFEITNKDLPVVLLNCPRHTLIRWKFSDGSYINWETTAQRQSLDNENKYYADNCTEVVSGSNAFYALFYSNRGDALSTLKDYAAAIADYDQAISLDPKDAYTYYSRGLAKASMNDYTGAIADYDKAISINPKDADTYYSRGIAKASMKDYTGAIADYDKAISINPKNADTYYSRGLAKASMNDYAGAIADYDKAISINPKNADTYNNRGAAKCLLKNYIEAIADYDEAIKLNPQNAGSYYNRGLAKCLLKNYAEAIVDYDQAISLNLKNADIYNNRGVAKVSLNDYTGAIADYNEALRLDPKHASAYSNRGIAENKLKRLLDH